MGCGSFSITHAIMPVSPGSEVLVIEWANSLREVDVEQSAAGGER